MVPFQLLFYLVYYIVSITNHKNPKDLSVSAWRWPAYRPKHVVWQKIIKRTPIVCCERWYLHWVLFAILFLLTCSFFCFFFLWSSKFSRKLNFVDSLAELAEVVPLEQASIPDRVKQWVFVYLTNWYFSLMLHFIPDGDTAPFSPLTLLSLI
jgi:hypothetical protein